MNPLGDPHWRHSPVAAIVQSSTFKRHRHSRDSPRPTNSVRIGINVGDDHRRWLTIIAGDGVNIAATAGSAGPCRWRLRLGRWCVSKFATISASRTWASRNSRISRARSEPMHGGRTPPFACRLTSGAGQTRRQAGAAVDRGIAFHERQRRPGPGVFFRWHHRRGDRATVQDQGQLCHRPRYRVEGRRRIVRLVVPGVLSYLQVDIADGFRFGADPCRVIAAADVNSALPTDKNLGALP